jgi:site-specific recombinase
VQSQSPGTQILTLSVADALMILASHVQAIGLSQRVRRRTAVERPLDSPFAALTSAVRDYVESQPGTADADEARAALGSHIARCARGLADVSLHLENYGVSTDLVYQLERARLSLERMTALVAFRAPDGRHPRAVAQFVASLIRANAAQTSVRALISRAASCSPGGSWSPRKTGEHYITRDFGEYRAMLASAAIGGAVTGVTVTVKLVTTGHGCRRSSRAWWPRSTTRCRSC